MFLLRSSDQALPQLRGNQIFRTLLNQKAPLVNKIFCAPGHVAVVLHGSASLCVFDLVPTSALHISSTVQEALTQAILRKSPADANRLLLENPALLIVHSTTAIVSVSIEGGKLLAIGADGSLLCWQWISKDLAWRVHSRGLLLSPLAAPLKLTAAVHLPKSKSIVCWESTSGTFGRLLQCTSVDLNQSAVSAASVAASASSPMSSAVTSAFGNSNTPAVLKLPRTEAVSFERDDVTDLCCSSQSGVVWLLSGPQRLPTHIFSLRTARLVPIRFQVDGSDSAVLLSSVFASTGELLVLTKDARVLVCPAALDSAASSSSNADAAVIAKPLCTLQGSTADVVEFVAHRNVVALVRATSITFFDIKTGIPLGTEPTPFRYERGGTSRCGLFERLTPLSEIWLWSSANGAYQLQVPPVLQVASKMHSSTVGAASSLGPPVVNASAGLCADWGLAHRSAKYLLDQAIDSKHYSTEARKTAALELLPHLPNPALVLGLCMNLESTSPAANALKSDQVPSQQQQFRSVHVHAEVGNFLESFSGGDGSAVGHEAAVAAEKSFGAFTPLNVSLLPLLSRHQQLQAQRHLNHLTSTHHHGHSHSGSAPPGLSPLVLRTEDVTSMAFAFQLESARDLREISRSAMESLMRNNGAQLLERLEQMFQLDASSPRGQGSLVSVSSSNSLAISPSSSSSSAASVSRTFPIVASELLHEEESPDEMLAGDRSPQHPYFEILCKLYYDHRPSELCRFVRSVEKAYVTAAAAAGNANMRRSSRTHYERALLAIPAPPNAAPSPGTELVLSTGASPSASDDHDRVHNLERIQARADLLCCAGQVCDAAHLLLQSNMWNEALALLKERADQDVPHFEIFHALITHSIVSGSDDRTQRVLDLAPATLNALNLIRLVRISLPQQPQLSSSSSNWEVPILTHSASELSISSLLPKLQSMCAKQPVDLL